MNNLLKICFLLFILPLSFSYAQAKKQINIDDIVPWCVVSFDALERQPQERISMLKDLGFSKYGYNWREEHLDYIQEEFVLAKENNMDIEAIFLWLNAKRDSIGKLSPLNKSLLTKLEGVDNKPDIWLSFSPNYFENLSQEEAINRAIKYIRFIKDKADALGVGLALYNHSGWFGNTDNQVDIINRLPDFNLKIVYNFHHAQEDLDDYTRVFKNIKPYLTCVNLNGLRKDGPKILTIGEGDYEYPMIKSLFDLGYDGPWGVLGHIKTEDVEQVLKRNMAGIQMINQRLLQEED
ncbi:TIM barrel protein [Tamlana sp. 2_MG-2023]|uniref:sugar phosphate isomerase/epimerase family protein n=1 Tax=unclassified Tamlana TaxID=2614803 RepID=UPI0026E3A79D|nr:MULTISPECIES: TIM barrel protein [unclassified Tamlana]MDO6759689.1 TIM barrel protein [Tamlana sp. 2_MG-2023]MDO6791312.1 TIM barrel protein [Tamlana sp. 1_MG-2023]